MVVIEKTGYVEKTDKSKKNFYEEKDKREIMIEFYLN